MAPLLATLGSVVGIGVAVFIAKPIQIETGDINVFPIAGVVVSQTINGNIAPVGGVGPTILAGGSYSTALGETESAVTDASATWPWNSSNNFNVDDGKLNVVTAASAGLPNWPVSNALEVRREDNGMAAVPRIDSVAAELAVGESRYYSTYWNVSMPGTVGWEANHPFQDGENADSANWAMGLFAPYANDKWRPIIRVFAEDDRVPFLGYGLWSFAPGDSLDMDSTYVYEVKYTRTFTDSAKVSARISIVRSGGLALLYDDDDFFHDYGNGEIPLSDQPNLRIQKLESTKKLQTGINGWNVTYTSDHDYMHHGPWTVCADDWCGGQVFSEGSGGSASVTDGIKLGDGATGSAGGVTPLAQWYWDDATGTGAAAVMDSASAVPFSNALGVTSNTHLEVVAAGTLPCSNWPTTNALAVGSDGGTDAAFMDAHNVWTAPGAGDEIVWRFYICVSPGASAPTVQNHIVKDTITLGNSTMNFIIQTGDVGTDKWRPRLRARSESSTPLNLDWWADTELDDDVTYRVEMKARFIAGDQFTMHANIYSVGPSSETLVLTDSNFENQPYGSTLTFQDSTALDRGPGDFRGIVHGTKGWDGAVSAFDHHWFGALTVCSEWCGAYGNVTGEGG